MEQVSRYIEFDAANESVFSIELARLLFAAASEVDVVAKLVCDQVNPGCSTRNINDYKLILLPALPDLPNTMVFVPRYGLQYCPWSNWSGNANPDWWRAYNNVKHQRDTHFNQATLKNALNALGALLILTFHYYARKLADDPSLILSEKRTTSLLLPRSTLFHFSEDWYYSTVVV